MAGVSKLLPTYVFVCPDGNSCDNDLKNQRHRLGPCGNGSLAVKKR